METRRPVVAVSFLVCGLLLGALGASGQVMVTNDNGEVVGELVDVEIPGSPTQNSTWVVYNATLERLFRVSALTGWLVSDQDACPYFESVGPACTGQPYLDLRWRPWITRCGSRYFRSLEVGGSLDFSDEQLQVSGTCAPSGLGGSESMWQAEEMQEADFSFAFVGPLHLGSATSRQQVAVDAVTPGGLAILFAFIAGAGFFLLRRLS